MKTPVLEPHFNKVAGMKRVHPGAATTGVLLKKGALKNFAIFTGKHLRCYEIFKNNYFEKFIHTTAFIHRRCFPMKCFF